MDSRTDLDLDRRSAGAADRFDDVEPCANRSIGIVLVGDRCAEDREHGVACELHNRPAVAFDASGHLGHGLADDIGPILGVHRLGDRRRTYDVTEERRDDAPLRRALLPISGDSNPPSGCPKHTRRFYGVGGISYAESPPADRRALRCAQGYGLWVTVAVPSNDV